MLSITLKEKSKNILESIGLYGQKFKISYTLHTSIYLDFCRVKGEQQGFFFLSKKKYALKMPNEDGFEVSVKITCLKAWELCPA